ncbi:MULTISPECIES: hypothetical protein [Hymenobacter]|uniref:Uncharacterized protein n=2 Tax=Hymenobacter TaxID=89966 RepID=A0A4Z0MBR2_9BACT|nr:MULTISPECIES: hypothetical protein [Hymenobacter]TGD76788.1 hypothetical protein EU557_25110 [Hymenobacter wooponensis]SNS07176.1 hypothetical protein SAMN06269173_12342 [Hymenobacter mucosus]
MKQPKKRWAWTARQRGRCHHRRDHRITSPAPTFLREKWHQHRARTRQALHQVLAGYDEGHVTFPYQPRHSGQYDWA